MNRNEPFKTIAEGKHFKWGPPSKTLLGSMAGIGSSFLAMLIMEIVIPNKDPAEGLDVKIVIVAMPLLFCMGAIVSIERLLRGYHAIVITYLIASCRVFVGKYFFSFFYIGALSSSLIELCCCFWV